MVVPRFLLSLAAVALLVCCADLLARRLPTETKKEGTPENFDGPAELPRVYVKSTLSDTPASGKIRVVKGSEALQATVDSSNCGDTIELQAGATFKGLLRLPAKSCDDAHWIILRTSAPDDALPPEGTRLTPCYAGVASLPGRPDFHCRSVRNVMARIEIDEQGGSGPLWFMDRANHYRLIGLEVTRGNPTANLTALAFLKEESTADHIVFDRVWMHGDAQDETARGVSLKGMTYVAIVDSYFSDFHCIAVTGACTDAQTLGNSGGNTPGGPYKILNNFLEASGENILFGGAAATMTPSDIEIRRNHLFKPRIWKEDEPGFVGGRSGRPFIIKNHFELKNAQRVLFEGHVLENVWDGFTQTGFSILLTPKNQNNKCPACRVTDITIRYNRIRNVAGVLQIANVLSDAGGVSAAGERYSVHDLIVQEVHERDYQGFGVFAMILSNQPPVRDVRIEHVTAFVPRAIISISNATGHRMLNFTIANNIFSTTGPREIGSAGGGPANCAFQPDAKKPAGVFESCFQNSTITHNMVVGGSNWPPGNIMVKDTSAAGIRDAGEGQATQYRLCRLKDEAPSCKKPSSAIASGTDGRDIGADHDTIDKITAGVL